MLELHEPSEDFSSFDDWCEIYSVLRGTGTSRLSSSGGSKCARVLRSIERGLVHFIELTPYLYRRPEFWRQLWSGAAAHRAGVDWFGHLLIASAESCPDLKNGSLSAQYRHLRGELALDSHVWRHTEGDIQSSFGNGWSFRASLAEGHLEQIGWVDQWRDATPTPEERAMWIENAQQPFGRDLSWIGWNGNTLTAEQVPDAALQSLAGDALR